MKRIIATILVLLTFNSVFAQQDLIDKITKQAVEIDSLKRVVKVEKNNNQILQDSLQKLNGVLTKLNKIESEKAKVDKLLLQKNDSIALLSKTIFEKEKQIIEAKEIGRSKVLKSIYDYYKSKSFDDLILLSTAQSTQNDLQLLDNSDLKSLLIDLDKYHKAKKVLENKFEITEIKNAQNLLNQIKQQSIQLDNLKEQVDNYQIFNEGLKEMINKIITLDNKEAVAGLSDEVQKLKFNKILSEISLYIFNYDFNFLDYPYLSRIIAEIMKRKQPNPDADISDLLLNL